MTIIRNFNGYQTIEIPDNVSGIEVDVGSQGPGAYDCINYRGFEICNYEDDRPGVYKGKWNATDGMSDIEGENLPDLLKEIDQQKAEMPA